jgi:hypothetical protein
MSLNANVPPGKRMPLWGDLGRTLGDSLIDFSSNGVLDAISSYEHEFGRARLIERLSDLLLLAESQPGEAHKEFCSIAFDIVCTTNFDFLLERQYDATPRYVYPVVDEEQLSVNVASAGTLLLKLHGDLRHPGRLIVTEADYDGFLSNYPLMATYLSNQLITKTAVFVGYSLDDPDFRQIWHVVSERLGRNRRMAYSLMVNARTSDVARFERRGVKVINLPGPKEKYGEILAHTFRELREYLRDNIISVSKVTEEEPLRELLLPRDSTTRLCFFSLPLDLLPFYRNRVFPVVEATGFVPVTSDDVVAPGDNISAKIDALIDRASIMVVEPTSRGTRAEFEMAVARLRGAEGNKPHRHRLRLIVITSRDEELPLSALDFTVVRRPNLITEDSDDFLESLEIQLRDIAHQVGITQNDEPQRLYAAKEYRAAVISAMTLLESSLRRQLGKELWTDVRRPATLRQLIDRATERGLIQHLGDDLHRWIRLRNEAVHTSRPVTKAEARDVVEGVMRVLAQN